MEKLFKLKENGTNVKTEIIAGITTFLAMAYILAVNPGYLGGIPGASPAAIFMATAISAAIATICMLEKLLTKVLKISIVLDFPRPNSPPPKNKTAKPYRFSCLLLKNL